MGWFLLFFFCLDIKLIVSKRALRWFNNVYCIGWEVERAEGEWNFSGSSLNRAVSMLMKRQSSPIIMVHSLKVKFLGSCYDCWQKACVFSLYLKCSFLGCLRKDQSNNKREMKRDSLIGFGTNKTKTNYLSLFLCLVVDDNYNLCSLFSLLNQFQIGNMTSFFFLFVEDYLFGVKSNQFLNENNNLNNIEWYLNVDYCW